MFWLLRTIPELDFEDKRYKKVGKVDEKERNKVCFNHEKTSYFLYLFFHHLNKTFEKLIDGDKKNLGKLSELMDSNFGCLNREVENQFQQDMFSIFKIESYQQYYKEIGLNISEEKDIYERLIQAVKNSRKKGYHGNEDLQSKTSLAELSINRITNLVGQFAEIKSEKEELKHIDDTASVDSSAEKKFKVHFKKIIPKDSLKSDDDWKNLCISNFDFVRQELTSFKDRKISAAKLAEMYDYRLYNEN